MIQSRFVWLPAGLIDLETALERVVAEKYGARFIAQWTPAALRREFEAQAYGGERTRVWDGARDWMRFQWHRGTLPLLKVSKADPPVIRAASEDFLQSSDHADRQRLQLILERREDPSGKWTYATDEAVLTALLAVELNARSSGDASDAKDAGAVSSKHREQDGPPPVSARTRVWRGRTDLVVKREELLYLTALASKGAWRNWYAPMAFRNAANKYPADAHLFVLEKTARSQCWKRVRKRLEAAERIAGSAAPNPE
jgi:hypothetical protein